MRRAGLLASKLRGTRLKYLPFWVCACILTALSWHPFPTGDKSVDNQPLETDEEIRDRLRKFARAIKSAGLLGDTAAAVGEEREAGSASLPDDGLPPMINTVPQVDR